MVTEMCAELARGDIYGSTTVLQNFCSQQLGDGGGFSAEATNEGWVFWSSIDSGCLLLTNCISTTLLSLKERGAIRVKRSEGLTSIDKSYNKWIAFTWQILGAQIVPKREADRFRKRRNRFSMEKMQSKHCCRRAPR